MNGISFTRSDDNDMNRANQLLHSRNYIKIKNDIKEVNKRGAGDVITFRFRFNKKINDKRRGAINLSPESYVVPT